MYRGLLIAMRPRRGKSPYRETLSRTLFACVFLFSATPGLVSAKGLLDGLAEAIEDHFDSQVESVVDDSIEDSVEDSVEEDVSESIEDSIVDVVEDEVEQDVADIVEDAIDDSISDSVEEVIEERIADTVEDAVEEDIASAVEDNIEESIAASVEESIDANVEFYAEGEVEDAVEEQILDSVIESIIDSTEEQLEARVDSSERHVIRQEWLVMAEEGALQALADAGYVFDRVTRLEGLGLQLAEVSAPASFDISEVREGVLDVVGSDLAQVDINHLYTAGVATPSSESGYSPRDAMSFPEDTDTLGLRIGMIDTAVDVAHPAFSGSHLQTQHFGSDASKSPQFHGTAIASMLSAQSAEYSGIAPASHLFAASVFERDGDRGEVASTASLVKALDWLAREQVEVINISLAGPPNRLLEAVLNRVHERGIPVLAAAGNAGPASAPLYPAAYESVVAITAVEADGRVFRLANRGDYLDLAAPGVNIRHAEAGGSYVVSSGTSFAVPFATVAVARLHASEPGTAVLESLYRSAYDLGPPGKDDIYGYGLLDPAANLLPPVNELAARDGLPVVGAL
jgi:hypothetical protein